MRTAPARSRITADETDRLPHCGNRAQAEFVYERSADSVVPLDVAPEAAIAALFTRTNLRGVEEELWRHTHAAAHG